MGGTGLQAFLRLRAARDKRRLDDETVCPEAAIRCMAWALLCGYHRRATMTSHDLSYATASTPPIRRWLIRAIENLSGRHRLLKIYYRWRAESAGGPRMWRDALDMIGTRLELNAPDDWLARLPGGPLIVIANHPFGIADGVAILSIAESVGRPYRVLINADFMRLPEVQALALPIDFNETKEALATNLKTRNEARRLLKEGVTLVIFPAGGVATAENPFGRAEELPWKAFTARLIQQSNATVLPVYFEGQNSALFHFISRYSLSLRLGLLVLEFGRHIGATVRARVGPPVSWTEIANGANGGSIVDELYVRVHRLAPGGESADRAALLPRPPHRRRRYPWDPPRTGA
jgi:putative hemolysin